MTTPAEDLEVITNPPVRMHYRTENPLGVPTSAEYGFNYTPIVSYLKKQRPKSVTNPIRKPEGTRAPSAWNHRWFRQFETPGRIEVVQRQGGPGSRYYRYWTEAPFSQELPAEFSHLWCSPAAPLGAFPIGVEQAARTAVLNKLRNTDIQLGVALAEAKKTASLVRHTAEQVVGGVVNFRRNARMSVRDFSRFMREMRGQKPGASFRYTPVNRRGSSPWDRVLNNPRQMSKAIPEKWLEYSYGWRPFLMEADGAASALASLLHDQNVPMLYVGRGGSSREDDMWYDVSGPPGPDVRCSHHIRVISECHYSITYRMPFGVLADVRDRLGLGLASTLWELTPYSFCLDWLVGVGDWFNSFGAQEIADFVEGSVSKIQRADSLGIRAVPNPTSHWQDVRILSYPKNASVSFGRMSREVLTHLPVPAFVPEVRNNLGLTQFASLVSLLVQSGAKPFNRI